MAFFTEHLVLIFSLFDQLAVFIDHYLYCRFWKCKMWTSYANAIFTCNCSQAYDQFYLSDKIKILQVCISDRHRPRKKQKNNKSGKGKEWLLRKKEQMRRRHRDPSLPRQELDSLVQGTQLPNVTQYPRLMEVALKLSTYCEHMLHKV